ncbi:acyl-CoA thioesterase [Virgibacillus alimentarius]|uniref:Acyl-CoA thioester hydrolase n=1 Tax=Virgibacillus alimentarius TaxID=698769 RepID=A0ABS4S5D0_9BACI|nr:MULTISPECIES: thioesterase family protein [Virgibacillus]MBP2256673.1 acyl-CoA thioester hydrolase [Virgibacillus alimentarius]HLR67135.1 thioesterase family protein [Virgibacillus sp.]
MKTVAYIEDIDQWKAEFSFYISIKIRFSETDMFGHVNNVSPFIYFEEARIEYLKSMGLFEDPKHERGIPIVADLQCDYHRQIYFTDQLKMYVKANHVGNTSVDIHYMGLNQKEELCLTGRGRMVYINTDTGKPTPLSEPMKEKLLDGI